MMQNSREESLTDESEVVFKDRVILKIEMSSSLMETVNKSFKESGYDSLGAWFRDAIRGQDMIIRMLKTGHAILLRKPDGELVEIKPEDKKIEAINSMMSIMDRLQDILDKNNVRIS